MAQNARIMPVVFCGRRAAPLWLLGIALAACSAVAPDGARSAREQAHAAASTGSAHTGARVYAARCAGCHGADATGHGSAPDLLAAVRTMGPRRFADEVLRRYDWNLPPLPDDSARDSRIDEPLRRRQDARSMPDWQRDPRVTAHVEDVYAHLWTRAQGVSAPGRPAR